MIKETTNNLKYNKGITLIALVITIIVLLILAGVAISMLSGDNGILNQAVKAKEETEKKSMQENIQLAVLSAMSNTNHDLTLESLKTEVKSQLGSDVLVEQDGIGGYVVGKNPDENEHLTDVYGVVDKEGKVGEGKWHFVKLTDTEETENSDKDVKISDGETTLIVGNKINYDANKDEDGKEINKTYTSDKEKNGNEKYYTYKTGKYTKEWGILGAEDGKILIAPMSSILGMQTDTMPEDTTDPANYDKNLYLKGKAGYENGVSELNKISEIYGYGKGAESARSVTVEDINKITGYDPNYVGQNVNKTPKEELKLEKYMKGTIYEYGNQVKYYWDVNNENPIYEGSNGVKDKTTIKHNSFNWYSGGWKESKKPTEITTKQYITTLTNEYYHYYPTSLTETDSDSEVNGISKNSDAYKMLFEGTKTVNNDEKGYWLSSSYAFTFSSHVYFAIRWVHNYLVGGGTTCFSEGESATWSTPNAGIRPAVTLRPDVEIDGTGDIYIIK